MDHTEFRFSQDTRLDLARRLRAGADRLAENKMWWRGDLDGAGGYCAVTAMHGHQSIGAFDGLEYERFMGELINFNDKKAKSKEEVVRVMRKLADGFGQTC